jgi:TonB family protein
MKFAGGSKRPISRHDLYARSRSLGISLAGFVVIGVLMAVAGGRASAEATASPIAFNIEPQSLEAALDIFNSTSNVQVLYETSLTSGRHSAGVHGVLTPVAALNALLAGTGLAAWRTTNDSYSLVVEREAGARSSDDIGRPPAEIEKYDHFLGRVQASFLSALCRKSKTRPGQYTMTLRFSIGSSGDITQTSLLGSTGDPERDAEIIRAVEHLAVGEAPPSQLAQPITMLITPRSPNATGDCTAVDGRGGNR